MPTKILICFEMSFICLVFEADGELKEHSNLVKEKVQFIRFNS